MATWILKIIIASGRSGLGMHKGAWYQLEPSMLQPIKWNDENEAENVCWCTLTDPSTGTRSDSGLRSQEGASSVWGLEHLSNLHSTSEHKSNILTPANQDTQSNLSHMFSRHWRGGPHLQSPHDFRW